MRGKSILFLVRSVKPFFSNRKDVDDIILKLTENGHNVEIYDTKEKFLLNVNSNSKTSFNFFPKWLFVGKSYLLLNFLVLIRFCLKNQGKYDIVQINYCREEFQLIPNLIKGLGKKLYIFFYGSDLNLRNFIKNNFNRLFYISEKFIVTNRYNYKLLDKYLDKERVKGKKNEIFLPQEHFKLYEPLTINDKINFKSELELPEKKTIIMVGNNGTENEQHEAMILQLHQIRNIGSYFFVFPFANRLDTTGDRIEKIKILASEKLGEENCRFIPDFISHQKMAAYRMSSDIFLHLRRIDMLAVSMFESNMAYCQIITGDWLPYQYYLEKVKIEVVSDFSQINSTIEKVLNDPELPIKLKHNREIVLRDYYYNVLDKWIRLYE